MFSTTVLCNFLASLMKIDQFPVKTLRKVYTQARLLACLERGVCSLTTAVTTADIVIVDIDATTKEQATRQLAERLLAAGRITEIEGYLAAVAAREEHFPTGIEGGIAIPHAQSDLVVTPSVAVATSTNGIDFGADDGPSHLIFLIAAPASGDSAHLEILAALARKVMHEEFRDALRADKSAASIADTVTREVQK
jgi:fructose-specific phosphotransferase system IIA component